MSVDKKFEEADFFCVKGETPESFEHRKWNECLSEYCGGGSTVTIVAYSSKKIDKSFSEHMADEFIAEMQKADGMAECWWEEYGDMEGENPPLQYATNDDISKLKAVIAAKLHDALVEHSHVWQCNKVAEKIFDLNEGG